MGQKSQRRKEFLAQNPFCCFCGGSTPAVEEDHIPGKRLFLDKQWPVGFVFPACVSCNRRTRHHEQIVSMLSRMFPDARTEKEREQLQEVMRAVAHNYPEVLTEMRPSARQLRTARDKYGIEVPAGGSLTDLPVLSVQGPRLNEAVNEYGRKLALAFFYKHAGRILPPNGGIGVRWYANVQISADEIPREFAPLLSQFPEIVRNKIRLDDQFMYRIGVTDDRGAIGFLALFRESFAILGYVSIDANKMTAVPEAERLGPFSSQPA